MVKTDVSGFVGYCGLYCDACGIRQEKIKNAVNSLRGIIAHYGFDKVMPELAKWEQRFEHYAEFDQVMEVIFRCHKPSMQNPGNDITKSRFSTG